MDVVKLDNYEYEIHDLYDDRNKYLQTLVYIDFEERNDASIYDIMNDLSVKKTVHLDGVYYRCKNVILHHHEPIVGGTRLKIILIREGVAV